MPLTYGEYLKVPELLALQQPVSGGRDHDEMLFIVIHQVYELWFRQQIHELAFLQSSLESGDDVDALRTLKRKLTILKTMVGQIDVLETMTPVHFLGFRGLLQNSSGFQSAQFREYEIMLGSRRRGVLSHYPEGSPERTRLEALWPRRTVWQSFLVWLRGKGHAVPEECLQVPLNAVPEPNDAVQGMLLKLYREHPSERAVCELLVDLDEGLQEWRYRHVKMVERTIGFKQGTGGSPGVAYLRETLFRPLFADLWAIRTQL